MYLISISIVKSFLILNYGLRLGTREQLQYLFTIHSLSVHLFYFINEIFIMERLYLIFIYYTKTYLRTLLHITNIDIHTVFNDDFYKWLYIKYFRSYYF